MPLWKIIGSGKTKIEAESLARKTKAKTKISYNPRNKRYIVFLVR